MTTRQLGMLIADAGFALIVAGVAYSVTDRPGSAFFVLAVNAILLKWYLNARVPIMTFVAIAMTGAIGVTLFWFLE